MEKWQNFFRERYTTELAAQLPKPIFDPTTKSTHDIPIDMNEAVSQELVTNDEYDWLSEKSIKIYERNG